MAEQIKIGKKVFQFVVLDEAQFITNPTTKRFDARTGIQSTWRVASSGTPIENNRLDFWSIFRFLVLWLLKGKHILLNDAS
jgi:SNF2 family DNA or RNA helicase